MHNYELHPWTTLTSYIYTELEKDGPIHFPKDFLSNFVLQHISCRILAEMNVQRL